MKKYQELKFMKNFSKDLDQIKYDLASIRQDIALLKQDIVYIKERITKVETAVYSVGGVVILAVLGAVINFFIRSPIK